MDPLYLASLLTSYNALSGVLLDPLRNSGTEVFLCLWFPLVYENYPTLPEPHVYGARQGLRHNPCVILLSEGPR